AHSSGHLHVAKWPALSLVGITRDTPDQLDGVIRRDPQNREPSGVLEEQAAAPFLPLIFKTLPPLDEKLRRLDEVQSWYASFGITTAHDALSNPLNIQLLKEAARQNRLALDIVSFPMWTLFSKVLSGEQSMEGVEIYPLSGIATAGRSLPSGAKAPTAPSANGAGNAKVRVGLYESRHKIGGIKITTDGSPAGKTAYMTQPYLRPPEGKPSDYRAYPVVAQPELDQWLDFSFRHGIQVQVHVNGDAAIDSLLAAVSKARETHGAKDMRPVAVHAQTARHDQIDAMARLGIVPSFFSAHTYFWGDWHINETFGRERAYGISPMAYAASKGVVFSNHTDSPIVPPDMLMLSWTAVNRLSRSGVVVGPAEKVSPYIALKAITSGAAYQMFEEASKGTLEVGKRADLVALDANPLKVDPLTIKDVAVVETFKDGRSIYRADELGTKWAPRRPKIPFIRPLDL
ncbi:MAG: amidohydrolase family protein, partial [Alphaproteobacteria bacterium]